MGIGGDGGVRGRPEAVEPRVIELVAEALPRLPQRAMQDTFDPAD